MYKYIRTYSRTQSLKTCRSARSYGKSVAGLYREGSMHELSSLKVYMRFDRSGLNPDEKRG